MIIFSNEASFRGYEFNYSRPRLSPTNRSGSLSSVSTKKREFFPRGKRKERKNLVFRKWKEATTVRFFDQHLFDPRTSEADTCLWHPSSDDFVKSSGKVIQSCSGTGLCRRADINDLASGNVFVKKTLSHDIVSSIPSLSSFLDSPFRGKEFRLSGSRLEDFNMLPFFVQVSLNSARNRIKTRRNLKFRQINIKGKYGGSPFPPEEFRSWKCKSRISFFFLRQTFRLKSRGFFFQGKGEDPLDRVG